MKPKRDPTPGPETSKSRKKAPRSAGTSRPGAAGPAAGPRSRRSPGTRKPSGKKGGRSRDSRTRTPRKPDAKLLAILKQIGTPEQEPFRPDPFQVEALDKVRHSDVLVSAPTGAGKTWIAVEAIRECLGLGGSAWYACPLKALSNAKFEEFKEIFGEEAVGIVTGDRKENAVAPVVVGTTEILRNQLYDCMSERLALPYELVILDEAHYLGEEDRGVVWEETLIYMPASTRLLLLSATIENTAEIAEWLVSIRGVDCAVVEDKERPVPLYPLFLYPDGRVGLLSGKKGLASGVVRYLDSLGGGRGGRRPPRWNYRRVLRHMRENNLLPAIFFLKSRADCDRAILQCEHVPRSPEQEQAFERDLEAALSEVPYLRTHRSLHEMRTYRVASHHAGQLPFWKVLVEQMMLRGHLDAIFATSTVAGGVNFPARTVALVQSDRFTGKEFQDLSATDLQQMIGRAGRRGKDRVGFALVLPGPYQDPKLVHERLRSPPDPIWSQIRINFSMTLNLLHAHRPAEVRRLLDHSLAAFQQERRVRKRRKAGEGGGAYDVREALWEDFVRHKEFLQATGFVDDEDTLTWEGTWAAQLRLDSPLLVADAIRKGAFDGISPEELAGMMATFVVEGERRDDMEGALRVRSGKMTRRINRMARSLAPMLRLLKRRGFDAPEIPLWPGAAVYLWATGVSWDALRRVVPLEEGNLAMMIVRTADHLNQLMGLRDSHPEIAEAAAAAVPLIFREPVWI